ncbi:hypothetical protein F4779DRAFT_271014 [Xylariaceae sp. FL0662B]|nr:hypothetical protein F4779DRAFT_271014 [Xylariaceae sp. FL0662B]
MAPSKAFRYCTGSPSWTPETYTQDADRRRRAEALLAKEDLQSAIAVSFALPPPRRDPYVYHAMVSVTLPEAQRAISLGRANGLHAWYRDIPAPTPTSESSTATAQSQPLPPPPPPRADTEAYLAVFSPYTSTAAALRTLGANAKKHSLRAAVAAHLEQRRFIHGALASTLAIPRVRNASVPPNPYLDFIAWSSRALEWAGPCAASEFRGGAGGGNNSHPVLAILMHHFGCACPSHEALEMLRVLAAGRPVLDVGSGGGYWTWALRGRGVRCVAVDNQQSAWRCMWVRDTVVADGATYLAEANPDAVLLLVYPVVGGDFTRAMLRAYRGDTLAVVGTQNRNGYTGFRDMTMDEFMAREHADEWVKVVQVPLPSFPGKDEALFVFQRGERAPRRRAEEEEEAKGEEEKVERGGGGREGGT